MTDVGSGKRVRIAAGKLRVVVAAMALLAVSPTIASVADSRLDGIWLSTTEAVFGEPASAQTVDPCVIVAVVDFDMCLESFPWFLEGYCAVRFLLDMLLCAAEAVN